jgi:hypothetical protein
MLCNEGPVLNPPTAVGRPIIFNTRLSHGYPCLLGIYGPIIENRPDYDRLVPKSALGPYMLSTLVTQQQDVQLLATSEIKITRGNNTKRMPGDYATRTAKHTTSST